MKQTLTLEEAVVVVYICCDVVLEYSYNQNVTSMIKIVTFQPIGFIQE